MGKSKFPGKPSKLINKKRISVLQSNSEKNYENHIINSGGSSSSNGNKTTLDENDSSNGTNTTTTSRCRKQQQQQHNDDGDNIDHLMLIQDSPSKLPSSEPPDGGGGLRGGGNHNYVKFNTKNHNNKTITTRARNNSNNNHTNNNNNINNINNNELQNLSKHKNDVNLLIKKEKINNCHTEKLQPIIKKKTVTFKNSLETSDDIGAIKRVYNPVNKPLVSIIKRDCLNRSTLRLGGRNDCIVRPSRLTDILKNNEQFNLIPNPKLSLLSNHNNNNNNNNMMDDIITNEFNTFSKSSIYIDGKKYSNDNHHHHHHSNGNAAASPASSTTSSMSSASSSSSSNTATSSTSITGDKRFILPKRSMHSCRVIKPNKRFLDNDDIITTTTSSSTTNHDNQEKHNDTNNLKQLHVKNSSINNEFENESKSIEQQQQQQQQQSQDVNFSNNNSKHNKSNTNNNNNIDNNKDDIQNDADDINHTNLLQTSHTTKHDDILSGDFSTKDDKNGEDKPKSFAFNTALFANNNQSLFSTMTSSKLILRQPRLQYDSQSNCIKETDRTLNNHSFALNIGNNSNGFTQQNQVNPGICGVCDTIINQKNLIDSKKYGIYCCDICRKFISKTTKRSVASSGVRNINLQCIKGDGLCAVLPSTKSTPKNFKRTYKERCAACWLKKCINCCHFPSGHKIRLNSLLSTIATTNSDELVDTTNKFNKSEDFHNNSEKSNHRFTNSTNSTTNTVNWNKSEQYFDNSRNISLSLNTTNDISDTNSLSKSMSPLSNSLIKNNVTFGTLPPNLKVPTLEPNVFKNNKIKSEEVAAVSNKNISPNTHHNDNRPSAVPKEIPIESEGSNKTKSRKKDKSSDTNTNSSSNSLLVISGTDGSKRQRIDLKGPRVKHVCRSASIVLGQTIATFPDDNISPILENMDTPPRPESPNNSEVELPESMVADKCTSCIEPNNTDLGLSPPATPTYEKIDECSVQTTIAKIDDLESICSEKEEFHNSKENKNNLSDTNNKPPTTRKIGKPVLSTNVNTVTTVSTVNNTTTRNLNSFSKKTHHRHNLLSDLDNKIIPTTISIDFWENYDPAEVSQYGFGLIVTESVPMRALCFLCGSTGLDPMIFCACCCEPYHQYCVADEYNFKHSSLDETMNSLLDTSINPIENINLITNRLNWLCPRCTVCYTCNMSSGSKVKCQKCQKNYHTTCLGTSKRLLGADRPLICASCLKCKSCGTTKVSKFVGNLPMCSQCFKLRKKGNFCPICQKCYEDNDFDLKMMECGGCQKWVHAKCEGLSDEQYNLLSTLPENIEFICRMCSSYTNTFESDKNNCEWRDAVSAEFKSGLLGVIKLLSKRRQACALLKVSPRKKLSSNCVCQVSHVVRNLQFKGNYNMSMSGGGGDQSEFNNDDTQNDVYDFKDSTNCQKCMYSGNRTQFSLSNLSLGDIKQKINSEEYVSLAEFNYDMNNVITSSNCDELMIAYKEILSEAFPWFQNETKACTDALEEDMFDSCNFSQNSTDNVLGNSDQQVPVINLPEDIDDCLYSPNFNDDLRICLFCKGVGESNSTQESRLLYCGHNSWVHINCAMWSAEVFEEIDGSLQNVHSAISRGRMIKCTVCGNRGATVGCNVKSCGEHYHYPCARKIKCGFMTDKTMYCPEHLSLSNNKKCSVERTFEVLRPVYVELDRKKKKMVEPSKINFMIGSLEVKKLGKVFAKFSDTGEAIVPIDFVCTRLYWSIKEPWKIVQYTIKTSIQRNIFSLTNDNGFNFTVDHSNVVNKVQMGLAQITRWHNSLTPLEDSEMMLSTVDRSNMNIGHTICSDETTTEEEPQNNADLLPPEIKDAIFEDLPHEILDGISMLDIFPKLMIYEDMLAIDSKSEGFFTNEYSKDNSGGNLSDEDMNEHSNKDLVESSWSITSGVNHVEDALLSAVRPLVGTGNRDIKRHKSDGANRNIAASRSQQRSSSLTWSCKLDNHSIKRRKITKGFQDIRFPDGVLLSLGRRKEDFPVRRASQTDECKAKNFTWSAAKKYCQEAFLPSKETQNTEKLKVSQLDGMDDFTHEESGDYQITIQRVYDPNTTECPVKCDRCHCTYRTHESFQRHLVQCEPLSTSESESETAPRSPDAQSPVQNILLDINKAQQLQTSAAFINNFNQTFPITTNVSNLMGRQNGNVQFAPIRGTTSNIQIQNNGMPIGQLNQGLSNIYINAGQQQVLNQQGIQQQFIPTLQNINQAMNFTTATPINTVHIGMDSSGQQIFTIGPQQQQQQQPNIITTGTYTNNEYKPLKKQKLNLRQSPNKNKIKNNNTNMGAKIKKTGIQTNHTQFQQQQQHNPTQIYRNQQNDLQQKPIIVQQTNNSHPIILQQVGNTTQPQNIVSYVDSNNSVQYVAVPSQNDFKQPQNPYLTTTNPLVQGAFLQTDSSGNLVLTNTPSGLQMLSTGALQLAQPTQPQVIGTLIQPQNGGIQCGVMSADQMVLGTSTMDMMTNPTMLLAAAAAAQPMYYGLETIVQNTVMSSQQFVSTAMQGVLSQNSSFSATTTQVFQASKIEPMIEVPAGYVVLNNVDGMIQQPTTNQTNILSANILQQPGAHQQIQPQQQINTQQIQPIYNMQTQQQQQQPTIIQTQQAPQPIQTQILQPQQQQQQRTQPVPVNAIHTQLRAPSPIKPIAKSSPIVVKKIQPTTTDNNQINSNTNLTQQQQQLVFDITTKLNKNGKTLLPPKTHGITIAVSESHNPIIITTTPTTTATANNNTYVKAMKPIVSPAGVTGQQLKLKNNTIMKTDGVVSVTNVSTLKPIQRKMNVIKPVNKVSSVTIKPKVISKPVPSKLSLNGKSTNSVPQLIAPKPNPGIIVDNKLDIIKYKHNIEVPKRKLSEITKPIVVRGTENVTTTPQNINLQIPATIIVKSIPLDAKVETSDISTTNTSNTIDNISNMNSVFPPASTNYTFTSVGGVPVLTTTTQQTPTSINLPTSTTSIQLPLTPFISPFSSNIPTNIVTPIQQVVPSTTTHLQNNQIISRPTNRVLPMQTVQQKMVTCTAVPTPSPTEHKIKLDTKIVEDNKNKNSIISTLNHTEPPPVQVIFETTDKSNYDENLTLENDNQSTSDNDIFMRNDEHMEEIVDNDIEKTISENNDTNTNDFDFMSAIAISDEEKDHKNCNNDDLSEDRTTPEVKEKICKILENLENEDCPKSSLLDMNYNENLSIELRENNSRSNYRHQKENINPTITNGLLEQPSYKSTPFKSDTPNVQKKGPRILYEIQSEDGFTYKSASISDIWEKVFEAVQVARKAHGLAPLPDGPLADMCGVQMLGLKTNALRYLIEQLPGVERCTKYTPKYHKKEIITSDYSSDQEDFKENFYETARCEPFSKRSDYDMFSWLASRHRKQPIQVVVQQSETELIQRRGTGSNLPMAMKYRTLKETYKDYVGVFRSHIHGRGLYCTKDIEAGEMVIEYAGELIRSTLTDKRERYYDSKGIGCYMFKIDDNLVVDATMRGNAARFINHSCEPNCYSKVVDILGHKHIIIFALRRIVQGEELTYDYKFPFEDVKIPCTCGSKRCRKYLN